MVVVGAGLAGLTVAHALIEEQLTDIVVVDREVAVGTHSSGRSAGMVRRLVEDPWMARLAVEGAEDLLRLGFAFRRTGSLLLKARGRVPRSVLRSVPHRFVTFSRVVERLPILKGHYAPDSVIETPDDGEVDVPLLLRELCARVVEAGGEVRLGESVEEIRIESGRVHGVVVDGEHLRARHVVLAVGAWAGEWGSRVGAPLPLQPRRRHIVATARPADFTDDQPWPWVWDLGADFYFRVEARELLWSSCDDSDDAPGSAEADLEAGSWLSEKLRRWLPGAVQLPITRIWAGHRTFAPDGRAVIGPDPRVAGLHWAVGLGGHGVTIGPAVGRRVAWGVTGRGDRVEAPYRPRSFDVR